MMRWRKLLLQVFVLVIIPLACYGVYIQYQTGVRINPEIAATLVVPYSAAIVAGQYSDAYQRFTSPNFRETCSLDEFLKAQHRNKLNFGDLLEVTPRLGSPFQAAGNLFSGRSYYQGGLLYRYSHKEVLAVWEVVRNDGVMRIDSIYQEFPERLSPAIF
jgi:hypothetical protein